MPIERCDGLLFRESLKGALSWLQTNRDQINQLNVFPVPDGDTGTNMLLTLQAAVATLDRRNDANLAAVARAAAHSALMGARGNSGVIFSQILRGFAQRVAGQPDVDARGLAAAFREGAAVAYRAVMKPTEGTILSVARAAAAAAERGAQETGDLTEVMRIVVDEARRAVERTPSQLAILREAGVVDAGGYGLLIILEGFLKTVRGEAPEAFQQGAAAVSGPRAVVAPEVGWGYCTEFIVNGQDLPLAQMQEGMSALGDSALVVGDEVAVRVHVHTVDPAALISYASGFGTISKLKVDDMTQQHHRILAQPAKEIAIVAVAPGEGFAQILRSLGVDAVVPGGATMNPSIQDLLRAVDSVPATQVLLLPDNGNVILTAQQVPQLTRKRVAVIPARNLPQGIAAVLAIDFRASLEQNAHAMAAAIERVQAIEVTHAVRDSAVDGLTIHRGDLIGLLNDRVVAAGGTPAEIVARVLATLDLGRFATLTIYTGESVDAQEGQALAQDLRRRFPGLEVDLHEGRQAHYPYVIAVE
jgi:DAK2 domain fusion protein YloV